MAVPLFLLNLPFLLLFLLVLCGRKKKKSNEETPQTPVKTSTTSKTPKMSNEPVKSREQRSKESQEKASPPASTSKPKEASKPTTSADADENYTTAAGNVEKSIEPKEIKEEETQETSEEREIKLANVILKIHKDFDPQKLNRWKQGRAGKRIKKSPYPPSDISNDFLNARKAYKMHKCTHLEKKRTEDEQCDVCKAYFDWIGMLYELHYLSLFTVILHKIEEDYFDYGGKLPVFLENTEWLKVKEQLEKDMGEEKKPDPPVGTEEERKCKIEEEGKKVRQIIDHVDWNSSDEEFKQRIAKDFEETRKIYREHDCRGLGLLFSGFCPVCLWYMGDKWTGRIYKEVLENENRFPDGMRKQLEEDFYFHKQNFERDLPKNVENKNWIQAKERIAKEGKEDSKRMKTKKRNYIFARFLLHNKAKDGKRQI